MSARKTVPIQDLAAVARNGSAKIEMNRITTSQNASGAQIGFPTISFLDDATGKRHTNQSIAVVVRDCKSFGIRKDQFNKDTKEKDVSTIVISNEETVQQLHDVVFEPLCKALTTPAVFKKMQGDQKFRLVISGCRREASKTADSQTKNKWSEQSVADWSDSEIAAFQEAATQYNKDHGIICFSKCEEVSDRFFLTD